MKKIGRLIDADALIEFIDAGHLRHPSELCFSELDVVNMLNHAPIAYDVEKVVAELEEEKFDMDNCRYDVDLNTTIDMAISVVKRGGV